MGMVDLINMGDGRPDKYGGW